MARNENNPDPLRFPMPPKPEDFEAGKKYKFPSAGELLEDLDLDLDLSKFLEVYPTVGTRTEEGAPTFRGETGTDPFAEEPEAPLEIPEGISGDLGLEQEIAPKRGPLEDDIDDIFRGGTETDLGGGASVTYPGIAEGQYSREKIQKTDPALYNKLFGTDYQDDPQFSLNQKLRIEEAGLTAYANAGGKDKTKLDRLTTIQQAKRRNDSFGNEIDPSVPFVDANGVPTMAGRDAFEDNLFKGVGGNPYLVNPRKELSKYWAKNQRSFFTHVTGIRWEDADKLTSKQRSEFLSRFAQTSKQVFDQIKGEMDKNKQIVSMGMARWDRDRSEKRARAGALEKRRDAEQKKAGKGGITQATADQARKALKGRFTKVGQVDDTQLGIAQKIFNSLIVGGATKTAAAIEEAVTRTKQKVAAYWTERDKISKIPRKQRQAALETLDKTFRRVYGAIPRVRAR